MSRGKHNQQLSLFDIPLIGDWVEIQASWPESKCPYIGKIGQVEAIETNGNPIIKIPGDNCPVCVPQRLLKKVNLYNPA
jgi:hypothetical protein